MADVKISALPAVATPAGTDEFAVNQGGVTKKVTLSQLLGSAEAGSFSTVASAGDVTVGGDALAAALSVFLNTAAGQTRRVRYRTGGVDRWAVGADATAEGGSDAGSDFEVLAYDDAGSLIGTALKITRADMAAVFGGSLRSTLLGIGAAPDASRGLYLANTGLTGTSQWGAQVTPVFNGSTVEAIGFETWVETAAAAFTVTNAAGARIGAPTIGAGSAITTLYGLYVAAQAGAATNWGVYVANNSSFFGGEVQITGALNHDGTTWGLAGVAPSAPQTGYTTFTNLSTLRTGDADTLTTALLADIVGTLIVDLKAKGVISA